MNRENKQASSTPETSADINRYDYNCTPENPVFISTGIIYDVIRPTPWMDMHAELEIYIHLAGGMRRRWDGLAIDVKPGDVCFAGSYEPHGYQLLDVPVQGIVMEVAPDFLAKTVFPEYPEMNWLSIFTMPPEQRSRATPPMRAHVLELYTRLLNYGQGDEPASRFYRRLALFELLLIFATQDAPAQIKPTHPAETYAQLIPAITLAVNSRQLIPNSEAAAACHMGHNPFILTFEKVMGVSFTKFALRHRIDAACKAIALTQSPIKVIAEEFGFANVSHLHRLFVAHYHCTPVEFRQRMKERATCRIQLEAGAKKTPDASQNPPVPSSTSKR